MSKKSRSRDNSKRQQPIQQQRAQARNPTSGHSKLRETHHQQIREGGNGQEPSGR